MARSGSRRRSYATNPDATEITDDDIIMKQLQADLDSQSTSVQTSSPAKVKKRRSRDVDGGVESSKKKRRKSHAERESKLATIVVSGIDDDLFSGTISRIGTLSQNLANGSYHGTAQLAQPAPVAPIEPQVTEVYKEEEKKKGKKKKEEKVKKERDSRQSIGLSRTSLGSNSAALMESVLKFCTPATVKEFKQESLSGSESNIGLSPAVPKDSGVFVGLPTEKARSKAAIDPILPEGYQPGPENKKKRFHCPVDDCKKQYTRKGNLGEHMNTAHAGQILNDNHDGTMTVITQEEFQRAISAKKHDAPRFEESSPILPPTKHVARSKIGDSVSHRTVSVSKNGRADSLDAISNSSPALLKGSTKPEKATMLRNSAKAVKARPMKHAPGSDTSYEEPSVRQTPRRMSMESPKNLSIPKSPSRSKSTNPRSMSQDSRNKALDPRSKSVGPRNILPSGIRHDDSEDIMEDWEIEPGLIQVSVESDKEESDTEEDTAFSSSYIHSATGGIKLAGAHFQVRHIAPGTSSTPDPVPYPRICSVASGKLDIQIGGSQFSIGQHGMWCIRAGQKCTAVNRRYIDAVIHISTINIS